MYRKIITHPIEKGGTQTFLGEFWKFSPSPLEGEGGDGGCCKFLNYLNLDDPSKIWRMVFWFLMASANGTSGVPMRERIKEYFTKSVRKA